MSNFHLAQKQHVPVRGEYPPSLKPMQLSVQARSRAKTWLTGLTSLAVLWNLNRSEMTPRLRLGPGLERGLLTNSGLYRVQCRNFSISRPRRSDLPKVPLWINGEAVSTSSAGTARTRHSKTREESCQVVLAGEQETYASVTREG